MPDLTPDLTPHRRRIPWAEYGIEAGGLALFMVSACSFAIVLFHPASPVVAAVPGTLVRRLLMGLAMGATAAFLIYSPWGKRSGAHFNPAVTLSFFRLGKVTRRDLAAYVAAQFLGGIAGVAVAARLWGAALAHPDVRYVVTQPGPSGSGLAFLAEVVLTFVLFSTVVRLANSPRWNAWAGAVAAALVALYITIEAPISGMSLNPARTLGSALAAMDARALWIYFTAPPLGMLLAAELFRRRGQGRPFCARLQSGSPARCLFCDTTH